MKKFFIQLLLALVISHYGFAQDKECAPLFSVIQLSDPQFGFANGSKDYIAEAAQMEQAVAIVNRLKPDMVIVTGDMINTVGKPGELAEFTRIVGTIDKSIPVWFIPGNHDIPKIEKREDMRDYLDTYGYDRFSFEHKGCAFIGINTNVIKDGALELEEEQFEWLEKQLADAAGAQFRFVFMHCPPFVKNLDEKETYSNLSKEQRERYMRLFERYGVKAVFAGHLHNNSEAEVYGVKVVTAGPVSKPLGTGFSGMNLITIRPCGYTTRFLAPGDFPETL